MVENVEWSSIPLEDSDDENSNKLTINKKFARSYEHRKQRQFLARERETKERLGILDSSDSE